ncbi:helix-turn-helix domain-containing protein [Fructilactobacillus cliffordii]|uniref:helix-turn-helix domain-containing protein n=1 Tax=Fructilactobacillus cliffordii TaxID=2940299 RepID=UPI00209279DC|nr:helix-turn-helix domain-containing protein [Fructilactobacillus cliffordii]USS86865.1 helix-turn-helix domain-containing protein [Fructilactobacillus cliffordii]
MSEPRPTKENKELGDRIKTIRLSLGKDVRGFGEMVKPSTSGSVVSRWERGINKPNAQRLKSIANLGGVSVNYLLNGAPNIHAKTTSVKENDIETVKKFSEVTAKLQNGEKITADEEKLLNEVENVLDVGNLHKRDEILETLKGMEEVAFGDADLCFFADTVNFMDTILENNSDGSLDDLMNNTSKIFEKMSYCINSRNINNDTVQSINKNLNNALKSLSKFIQEKND